MNTISAKEADILVGDSWFEGYTKLVEVYDEAVSVDDFNVMARADAREDTEYIIFLGGLTVAGTMDLSSDVHSIYVVKGALRARRIILGDAVLVVHGRLQVSDWVFGPQSEGIFEAGGKQMESDVDAVIAAIDAPLIALYDRQKCEFVLREGGRARDVSHLASDLLDEDDWGGVNPKLFLAKLIAGQPLFR